MSNHPRLYESVAAAADKLDAVPGGKKAANDIRTLIRSHRTLAVTSREQFAEIQQLKNAARQRMLDALAAIRANIEKIEGQQ